ncbi:hypothetical protein [Rhodococcus sp. NPDC003348]
MKALLIKSAAIGALGLAAVGIGAGVAGADPIQAAGQGQNQYPGQNPAPQNQVPQYQQNEQLEQHVQELKNRYPQFAPQIQQFHQQFPQAQIPTEIFFGS